jgi:hypothetical protein
MTVWRTALRLACVFVVCACAQAAAQVLPSEPIAFADGRVTVSGDVSVTAATAIDKPTYFNATDYDHSMLRLTRIDVSSAAHAGPHFTLLAEVRTEDFEWLRPYALYVRVKPWINHNFDIQVGRIPPTFGGFSRRTYANDNPLIGYPLGYQYLTTVRADAIPASVDDLLEQRTKGWGLLYDHQFGHQNFGPGVPLVSGIRWDTGVQVHGGNDVITGTIAFTRGTISNPLFNDDNEGNQVVGRVELRPVAGLLIGASGARGPFVSDVAVRGSIGEENGSDYTQTGWGADLEYSRNYYVVRAETVVSRWRLPLVSEPSGVLPLRAIASYVEGRYKFAPGFYVAARYDDLRFNDVTGAELGTMPWDADVTRFEGGVGVSILRNFVLKVTGQRNHRANVGLPGPRRELPSRFNVGAAQLVFWF